MAKKFVSAAKRIQNIQRRVVKTKQHMSRVSKTISRLNSNNAMSPRIKKLRIDSARALIKYLQSRIILNQALIKNLKQPE